MATWPSGKAGVCKTPIAGSNPAVASLMMALGPSCKLGAA
jgi:hypothetical protein